MTQIGKACKKTIKIKVEVDFMMNSVFHFFQIF